MLLTESLALMWHNTSRAMLIQLTDAYMLELTHWPLGDFSKILKKIIFKLIFLTDGCDISSEIAFRWTSLDLSDDKSTLVQVMARCRHATSHYLNQCWPRPSRHMASLCHNELKTLKPRQNDRHYADDLFKCIFLNENIWIPIEISWQFVPLGPIDDIPALAQIMAWRRPDNRPLSEPMMVRLPTHICVTMPQCVN